MVGYSLFPLTTNTFPSPFPFIHHKHHHPFPSLFLLTTNTFPSPFPFIHHKHHHPSPSLFPLTTNTFPSPFPFIDHKHHHPYPFFFPSPTTLSPLPSLSLITNTTILTLSFSPHQQQISLSLPLHSSQPSPSFPSFFPSLLLFLSFSPQLHLPPTHLPPLHRYDYEVLMRNSTFCLVPRGRRLGSFRFLEVLQAGCIPVLLANGWELPFSEVVDWTRCTVQADERLLLQVPEVVRSINASQMLQMRQQTQLIWNRYFSSVQKIVFATLEIVADRVRRQRSRPLSVWNSDPGALATNLSFSDHLPHFPFYHNTLGTSPSPRYTAVIGVSHGGSGLIHTTPLYKLIKNIARSKFVEKIVVVWTSPQVAPVESRLPGGSVPVHVVVPDDPSPSARHRPHPLVTSDAIFSLDEDVTLTTDELDFAFVVWRTFPDRLVGYPARSHHWDESKGGWSYSSRWTNSYSLVLTGAALYHRYWQHVYTQQTHPSLLGAVTTTGNCDDLLLNLLVAAVTRRPPIKLTQRKQYKDPASEAKWVWTEQTHFQQRSVCLNTFVSVLGFMPLRHSNLRLDPVLFKDKVSMQRKKYRQIEKIGS
ncbi:exostosin-1-like [Eriocheir sinensis]|uniref:exostosin-1-like n=1 Tax=Eriocheir sinensis TaxID=95602 RepID=UPI0021CACEE5|nr:exostosin-1-like [Eriocheir sinensis]